MFKVPKLCKMFMDFINGSRKNTHVNNATCNEDENAWSVHELLKKYIYMNDSEEKQSRNKNTDFLVYVLTTLDRDDVLMGEANRMASISDNGSTLSLHEDKIASSTLTDKITQSPTLSRVSSKSRIPVIKSSSKTPKCARKKHSSLMDLTKVISKESEKATKGYEFIKKFMGFQKPKITDSNQAMEELFLREEFSSSKDNSGRCESQGKTFKVPSLFIPMCSDFGDTVQEAIHEMLHMTKKLKESETRVKDIVVKYIEDKSLETELVNIICGHSKIVADSERKALNLASETWLQQAEVFKDNQRSLQNSLNSMVAQNRELQSQIELLQKKNEKLANKVILLDESVKSPKPYSAISQNKILETLTNNNDSLRDKIAATNNKLSDYEIVLSQISKKNDSLQQQLSKTKMELQMTKALYDKLNADHDLEIAKLLHDLQDTSSQYKESVEAGDILLDDLDSLKGQMVVVLNEINFDKFKRRGKSLADLIHLSRSYINELVRELSKKQNETQMYIKEVETIKDENVKYAIVLQDLQDDKNKLQKVVVESRECAINFKNMKEKCDELEEKIVELDKTIEGKNTEIAERVECIKDYMQQVENLRFVLNEKNGECAQLENISERLEQERNALLVQVNGVAQVLSATGAGEIAKELASTQEKLAQIQEQYYSVLADKNYLINQVEQYNVEKQTLMAYQKDYYDKLQVQQKDIEALEKALETFKEQLDNEKQTVLALQTDRVRHLEERSILTAIYERLRDEIDKVGQLEGAVSTMNKKASKLAMIAEYNKQLGEKLQSEVAERDVTINRLQNDVKDLNEYQLETTKEKAALCEELTQICGVKEILNTKLACELERNMMLGESKKEIENVATIQLREMQCLYQKEHNSLKLLLKEVKSMANERDVLAREQKNHHLKLVKCEKEREALVGTLADFQVTMEARDEKIKELTKQLELGQKKFMTMKADIQNEILYHKQSTDELRDTIDPLKSENANLKNTIEFLQCNIKKLNADLNESREMEMNLKVLIRDEVSQREQLHQTVSERLKNYDEIKNEHDKVKNKLQELNEKYKQLHDEYQKVSSEAVRFEKILAEKFSTEKNNDSAPSTNDCSFEEISARDEEILMLQEKLREFEEREMQLKMMFDSLNVDRDSVSKERNALIRDLEAETLKSYEYEQRILKLETDLLEAEKDQITIKSLEDKSLFYKQNLENLKNDYEVQIKSLNSDLFDLTTKLSNATSENQSMAEAKSKLERAHKEMAMKLLRAAQVLISEKVARQNTAANMKRMEEDNERIREEIHNKQDDINKLKLEIEQKTTTIIKQKAENEHLTALSSRAEARCKHIEEQMSALNMQAAIKNIEETHGEAEVNAKLEESESRCCSMKTELEHSHKEITRLQEDLSRLESKCACMEFQKCEAVLRLHELQGKMQTEKICHEEMKLSAQSTLTAILEMRENGTITPNVCNSLLSSIQNCMN